MGSNISGRKIPEFPISTHFLSPENTKSSEHDFNTTKNLFIILPYFLFHVLVLVYLSQNLTLNHIAIYSSKNDPEKRKTHFFTIMVAEDLHAGFSVGVICRFKAKFRYAQLFEEFLDDSHKVSKGETKVSHQALYLVKLSQMSVVHILISEHSVYWEKLHWFELFLLKKKDKRNIKKIDVSVQIIFLKIWTVKTKCNSLGDDQ